MVRGDRARNAARGAPGGVARLVYNKAGLGDVVGEEWIRAIFELLREKEIVESADIFPDAARRHLGGKRPVQVSKRVVRLVPATQGWRCQKCSIWRSYRGGA